MLDLGGFFASTEFLGQIASIIVAVLSVFTEQILGGFFAG